MRKIVLGFLSKDELLTGVYKNNKVAFALCSAEKDGAVDQLTNYYYCRESIIGAVPQLLENKKLSTRNTWLSVHKPLSIGDKKEPDVGLTKAFEKEIKNAMVLLNHFEKRNKWLASKVYQATHKHDKTNRAYVIKGSRWWITSPHLLSLCMLLMRIAGQEHFNGIKRDATNKKIIELIKATPETNERDYCRTRDAAMWNILLDNRRAVYGKKGAKTNFQVVAENNAGEGIYTLTNGNCYDKVTYNNFIKLCKEAKIS